MLWKSLQRSELADVFRAVLPTEQHTLNALLFFKIIVGDACKNAKIWYDGNYAKILFPQAKLDSQRISEFLLQLGDEKVQRKFFETYLAQVAKISGDVVIDSTGMPNEIDIPLTEYGCHGGEIESETRLIMVVDRVTHMPLYFRLVAGNIVDVSTFVTTFKLMSKLGANPQMTIMDAGYYSEKNIQALFNSGISFLIRLPAGRILYKSLIKQTNTTLETAENAVAFNKRALFIQKIKTEICEHTGYAYVCCDTKQRGQKMDKFIRDARQDNLSNAEISEKMPYIGKFVLVSDKEIGIDELLPLYYTRQVAENTFGFAKSSLNLLPLRVHSVETLRGYAFLSYLALLLSVEFQLNLRGLCSLQDALSAGHSQFCEVFGDDDVIPLEPSKQIKKIYSKLNLCGS
ncbi:hypothetical protein FACS1894122_11570 [Alphaproteobacteria bacterium]|nr:hypothetical protein FACS1894122_11570 [Alphaproteobacteria bacterium]